MTSPGVIVEIGTSVPLTIAGPLGLIVTGAPSTSVTTGAASVGRATVTAELPTLITPKLGVGGLAGAGAGPGAWCEIVSIQTSYIKN